MPEYPCFLVEATDMARYRLRRYRTGDEPCPGKPGPYSWCSADVPFGDHRYTQETEGDRRHMAELPGLRPPKDDPRWPRECLTCGTAFTEDDHWDLWFDVLYTRADTHEVWPIRELPVGAMWRAWWFEPHWVGPDGQSWMVQTPGGEWNIDGPSRNSPTGWDRTGTPPKITATPSILIGTAYHGWLRDGVLVDA